MATIFFDTKTSNIENFNKSKNKGSQIILFRLIENKLEGGGQINFLRPIFTNSN